MYVKMVAEKLVISTMNDTQTLFIFSPVFTKQFYGRYCEKVVIKNKRR